MTTSKGDEERQMELAEGLLERAMRELPKELRTAYEEARAKAPDVVDRESNLRWFLRFHNLNAEAAARRLAKYWRRRKKVFANRAFLRLVDLSGTGSGALAIGDVELLQTGYCVNLPRDQNQRSVLYIDVSKRSPGKQTSPQVVFFALQCVMENQMSQDDEFVMLVNVSNPFSGNFHMPNLELAQLLFEECMPIKDIRLHLIHVPSTPNVVDQSFVDTVYTWAKDRLSQYFGDSLITHVTSSKEDCLSQLVAFDLTTDGLPVSFGGTWSGGCEPWRHTVDKNADDDGDEDKVVDLKIDLDLSCLFRNVLWGHNQTVVAAAATEQQQGQRRSSVPSLTATSARTSTQSSVTEGGSSSDQQQNQQHYLIKPPSLSLDTSRAWVARATSTVAPAAVPPSAGRSQYLLQPPAPAPRAPVVAAVSASPAASPSARAAKRAGETKEERDRRRHQEVIYGRRKRERERIEIQVLHQEHHRLRTSNDELRREGDRLEELIRRAEEEIERGDEEE